MLNFFRSRPFQDEVLGELTLSRGRWRGKCRLDGKDVTLVLSGDRKSPHDTSLEAARSLTERFPSMRGAIANALWEHAEPYLDELRGESGQELREAAEGEGVVREFKMQSAQDVWNYAELIYIAIAASSGEIATEFGYTVPWDDEHTLGARFLGQNFEELCGSVLPP